MCVEARESRFQGNTRWVVSKTRPRVHDDALGLIGILGGFNSRDPVGFLCGFNEWLVGLTDPYRRTQLPMVSEEEWSTGSIGRV